MINSEQVLAAMVVLDDEEMFVVGHVSDIQRLADAGLVARGWDIKLDNGHRPYASPKKRVDHEITEAANAEPGNAITRLLAGSGLKFAHDLHLLTDTYLFRPTPAFWADLWVDFADGPELPAGKKLEDYYAVYRGCVLPGSTSIKFVRL
jgi:hypothetical protein